MKLLLVVHHHLDLWNVPAWFIDRLAREFPQLEIVHRDSYQGLEQDLGDAEVLFTSSLRAEQFMLAQKLRWIHAPSAAVHDFLFPALVESDVILTNSREVHGSVVAEHVMALIFALARKLPQSGDWQRRHLWGQQAIWKEGNHPQEIAGATLGLIGLGSIGRRVAEMASALGMRVVATREHVEKPKPDGVEKVFGLSEVDDMLGQSDFVAMAAPLIPATEGLINAKRLSAMKPSAYLINVGRGPQVDEPALIEALRTHRIAGAALDVFEQEPLPSDSPLWDVNNLLITPHTAGMTEKLWHRHYDLFSVNLRRYLNHEPLQFVVDKRKGY